MVKKEIKIKYKYVDDGGEGLQKAFNILFEEVLKRWNLEKKKRHLIKKLKFVIMNRVENYKLNIVTRHYFSSKIGMRTGHSYNLCLMY